MAISNDLLKLCIKKSLRTSTALCYNSFMSKSKVFNLILWIASAALAIAGITLIINQYVLIKAPYTPPPTPVPTVAPTPALTSAPSATLQATPSPTPYVKLVPVKIYFTERDIVCDIVPVGVVDGAMDTVDDAKLAAWLTDSASPGDPGNSIINGHRTWKKVMGYFSELKNMVPGEEIAIELEDGSVRYFEVTTNDVYHIDRCPISVMELGGETRLTLITCLGDYNTAIGTSESRIVVVCKPVDKQN